MNFPNPSLSFSEGNRNLNTGDIGAFVSHGKTLTTIITGIESSVILIFRDIRIRRCVPERSSKRHICDNIKGKVLCNPGKI
jgi:hypothetical protein